MPRRDGRKSSATARSLVIVESPAKARTLERILGPSYRIRASMGHVRDLPKFRLGVDVAHAFAPSYEVIQEKKAAMVELKKAAGDDMEVFLATDPDREGEAISWHLAQSMDLATSRQRRVEFHEITPQAVTAAFHHPRGIDMDLVNAQQARRILDRLVGYKISPLLGRKVQRGLSAGRVQSAALALIVTREREIQGFVSREYWVIEAELAPKGRAKSEPRSFRAALVGPAETGRKLDIPNAEEAHKLVAELERAACEVKKVAEREVVRHPAPPFTTSTLQQEGWRKLRFTAQRTMALAQQLYEGLPLGAEGSVGLITYMRTDSTRVAAPAIQETRGYIQEKFGSAYLPSAPRVYAKRQKAAQEAHEAIRPTSARRSPEAVKPYLSADQFKLYQLVWNRMVASQMASAVMKNTVVDIIAAGPARSFLFRASASKMQFPGFLTLYEEGRDEDEAKGRPLPLLKVGQVLDLLGLYPEQHFTEPPPRYTEATLVKALEENGIGRPSTYAPIIAILGQRRYVTRDRGRLQATELGMTVNDILRKHFPDIIDIKFTAQMEDDLDLIARGGREWVSMLQEFYGPFEEAVARASQTMESVKQPDEPTGETCEKCGRPMVIKVGRFGRFLSCSGFPKCKNARPLSGEKKTSTVEAISSVVCEKCGSPMAIKEGRYGKFLACTAYPKCKNAKPLPLGVRCPLCQGELVARRYRGRTFYGCSNYPRCRFTARELPQPQAEAVAGAR